MPKSSIKKTNEVKKAVKATKSTASKAVAEKKTSTKKTSASKSVSTKKTGSSNSILAKKTNTAKATKAVKTTKTIKSETPKKSTAKKTPTKKATITKTETPKKEPATKKADTSKKTTSAKKSVTRKTTTAKATKTIKTTKAIKAEVPKKSTAKKTTTKKSSTKKTVDKKTTAKKTVDKKTTTKKTTTKKTAVKKSSTTKSSTKKSVENKDILDIVEYYDLPYRYNQTVVKVLAQNPNTLFVYWDVSDVEIENLKKKFSDNFLHITKPVLVIHNLTNDYSFEIDINDFANNWYVNVSDTRCKYIVELGRRPIQNEEIKDAENNTPTQFVKILSSNEIESPNDCVLFYKENQKIYFKNVKTDVIVEKTFNKVYAKNLSQIYKYFDLKNTVINNKFDFSNPSSNNPSSSFM